MAATSTKIRSIDEYIAAVAEEQRPVLQKLRTQILAAVPEAEECISYGLAAFRLNGKPLVAFGATPRHCAFYLMSNTTVDAHREILQKYDTSTGTIRFPAETPLPPTLVRKLVKARIAESIARQPSPNKKRGAAAKSPTGPVGQAVRRTSRASDGVDVATVMRSLQELATEETRQGMTRFGIPNENALGVTVGEMRALAKPLGKNHALAGELWKTGIYEARMVASFVDEPALVTPAQMDRWARDFDNWGICDTVCFSLFDRTPHAWAKIRKWAGHRDEFVKRAAFALLACLTVHDKQASDGLFVEGLALIEREAEDDRHFVKKAVNWALRSIGKRNPMLHECALTVARRLGTSPDSAARWVGKDALRELKGESVARRLAKRNADRDRD